MARYLYSELASLIQARLNCAETLTRIKAGKPTTQPQELAEEWYDKHEAKLLELVSDHLPSGGGFDSGTSLDLDASHPEKLVFHTAFHHMNDGGYYDGWTQHTITVTPSLASGFHLRISGRNRNDIKEYIGECFSMALGEEVTL